MTFESKWEERGMGAVGQQVWTATINSTDPDFTEVVTVCAATSYGAIALAQESTQLLGCRIHIQEVS